MTAELLPGNRSLPFGMCKARPASTRPNRAPSQKQISAFLDKFDLPKTCVAVLSNTPDGFLEMLERELQGDQDAKLGLSSE